MDLGTGPGHGPHQPGPELALPHARAHGLEHARRGPARHRRRGCADGTRPLAPSWCARCSSPLAGATGWFARVMDRIPQALAAALLAGVLARFAFDAFASLRTQFTFWCSLMFAAYLLGRRLWPRYAVPGSAGRGCGGGRAAGAAAPGWRAHRLGAGLGRCPCSPRRQFSLASHHRHRAPALHRHHGLAEPARRGGRSARPGYAVPVSPVIATTGLAIFGAGAFWWLCAEPRGHHRRHLHGPRGARRPRAALEGCRRRRRVIYIAVGLLGGAVVGLIAAFPKELVLAVAGFALAGHHRWRPGHGDEGRQPA